MDPPTVAERILSPAETNAFRRLPIVRSQLRSIATVEGRLVWAVGTGGIIMFSSDGGETWSRGDWLRPKDYHGDTSTPRRVLDDLVSVDFHAADTGYVASAEGLIYRTTDGGRGWAERPGRWAYASSVVAGDDGEALAATDSGVIETADNGGMWQLAEVRRPTIAVGLGRTAAIALDADSRVHVRQDGASWRDATDQLLSPSSSGGMRPVAVAAADSSIFVVLQDSLVTGDDAAGAPITLRRSDNGGRNWRRTVTLSFVDAGKVRRSRFVSADVGWIVTERGELFITVDGGDRWRLARSDVIDAAFSDARKGYVITTMNTVVATTNGGEDWRTVAGAPAFRAAHFFDARRGVAVGDAGIVAVTDDGGRTWSMNRSGTTASLRTMAVSNNGEFWVAGDDGHIRESVDGGESWLEVLAGPSGLPIHALAIPQGGPTQGFDLYAITAAGEVYGVGGAGSWRKIGALPDSGVKSLKVVGSGRCFALASSGVWKSEDGCRTWVQFQRERVTAMEFSTDSVGWIAHPGWILRTRDGGVTWDSAGLGEGKIANAIRFANDGNGWAVGNNASVWVSPNAGRWWKPVSIAGVDTANPYWPDLLAVSFAGDTLVRALGEGGTVVEGSTRSGRWAVVVSPPKRRPALWYLVILASGVILLWAIRPRVSKATIVGPREIFATDRALRPGDRDHLNFGITARGLSLFLRNEGTEPPLTLAITGPWGHGKSSLMNLVREDLQREKLRVVWFNAWDHENERSLLASLLTAIQDQAVPGLMNPYAALRFRVRLVRHRLFPETSLGRANPVARIGLIALFVFLTTVLVRPAAVSGILGALAGVLDVIGSPDGLKSWWNTLGEAIARAGTAETLLLLSSGTTFVVAATRTLRAFGVKPSKLLAPVSQAARFRDLDASTGFRHRFAEDFRSVTAALGQSRLVVFIDDLDRCKPEAVMTVLEAINFLGQAGNCLIVLGIDGRIVRRDVYRYFLKIAKDARELDPDYCGDSRPAHKEARAQTRGFFEKLINIEVRLPPHDPEQVGRMLEDPDGEDPTAEVAAAARRWKRVLRMAKLALVASITILLTWALLGSDSADDSFAVGQRATAPLVASQLTAPAQTSTATTQLPTPTYRRVVGANPQRPGAFFPGTEPRRWNRWLVSPLLAFTVLVAIFYLVLKPDPKVTDSPEFKDALVRWTPSLKRRIRTPRAVKRFLNRLRYYAMMVGEPPAPTRRRWMVWLSRTRPVVAIKRLVGILPPEVRIVDRFPDDLLVALAAIEVLDPGALAADNQDFPLCECEFRRYTESRFGLDVGLRRPTEGTAEPLSIKIQRFRDLSGTVVTR